MSYGLYIGSQHTADGLSYLAGYGDEPSSHWLEIVPAASHPADARIIVGVTEQAELPGRLSDIAQVEKTARHLRVSYSHYRGVPAPLTNGGVNEHGVAVRDIWSTSRAELIAMTPRDQSGPNYSDLARIVLERARSAREAVELIGALIAQYGYSDYGGNSHLIADPQEAWVVIEFSGGQKLWAAERLGPHSIRASRPGYIGVVPIDQPRHPDYLYAPHLVTFAVAQGWFDPSAGEPFDLNRVYGDGKGPWAGARWIEDEMAARARRPERIGLADVMWAVRTARLTGDTAGYGQVVPLQRWAHPALQVMWHAPIGAAAAAFVPVFMGVQEVPPEYRQHRFLSEGESARFMDMRHARNGRPDSLSRVAQGVESTRSAVEVCKRLMYLVFQHPDTLLPELTAVWESLERRLMDESQRAQRAAQVLIEAGEPLLAQEMLSYYTRTELLGALDLAETLARSFEARTRVQHGFRSDLQPRSPEQLW